MHSGFMLLAGRVRKPQEEQVIAEILSKHFKRTVDPLKLFSKSSEYGKEALKQVCLHSQPRLSLKFLSDEACLD